MEANTAEDWKVTVRVGDTLSGEKEAVQMYKVEVRTPHKHTCVNKRFSHFVDFREEMRQIYKYKHPHLADNIPELPPKQLKFRVDHSDPHFIESRRQGLEQFCHRLLSIPHIVESDEFHLFFTGSDKNGGLMYSPASSPRNSISGVI
eukprot:Opistho-2@80952